MSTLVIWQSVNIGTNVFIKMTGRDGTVLLVLVLVAVAFLLLVCCGFFICLCHRGIFGICLGCFSFISMLWWIVFIAVGSVLVYIFQRLKALLTDICEGGTDDFKTVRDLFDEIYNEGTKIRAGSDGYTVCACNDDNPGIQWCLDEIEDLLENLGAESLFEGEDAFTDEEREEFNEDNPDCPPLAPTKSLYLFQQFMNFLGDVEETYECSGFCTKADDYMFHDCAGDESTPSDACYTFLAGPVMMKMFGAAGIIYIVTGILLFFVWCCHYGLCCRAPPGAKNKGGAVDYNQANPESNYDNYNYN